MNCKNCGCPITEYDKECPACGTMLITEKEHTASEESFYEYTNNGNYNEYNVNHNDPKELIIEGMKTPVFLIAAICFSIFMVVQLINSLTGGFSMILANIFTLIFGGITTIGLWKGYTATRSSDISGILNKISIYDAFNRVVAMIAIVAVAIFAILVTLVIMANKEIIGGTDQEEMAIFWVLLGAIIVVTAIIAIIILILYRKAYASRRKYVLALANAVTTGNYTATKVPTVWSYILGGFSILSGISSLTNLSTTEKNIDIIMQMGLDPEMTELLISIVENSGPSLLISGIVSFILGGFLILSAVWMNNLNKALLVHKIY